MKKYIIRELNPEGRDFSSYFDNDGLTEASGDYCNTLFIVSNERYSGFNMDEYKNIQDQAEDLLDGFNDVGSQYGYTTYKEVMQFCDISYNSRKCHLLKEWAKNADVEKPKDIATFLTITTGKAWTTASATGYCQGDYIEMVYCPERYKDGVKAYGEIWLGAGKEFCVIELDENGEEIDSCYGYIIADCQAWKDEDYKRLVCEWAGINEDETQLEMIENIYTTRHCTYRVA